ncbi:MAG: hypothetical protein Greene041662_135 [Candidatus Peregrinibacteria bacterium Greene0416_62]|nr:MAG: hypothetical protein Greene041662_135 [Candidatus Peregrinibacteria bacterium Greene0416_62]TSC99921.1 MAG: hypothetical protein Greene101449_455 [Candidatus Peregrinibacteria bacterium Greene1014_49]
MGEIPVAASNDGKNTNTVTVTRRVALASAAIAGTAYLLHAFRDRNDQDALEGNEAIRAIENHPAATVNVLTELPPQDAPLRIFNKHERPIVTTSTLLEETGWADHHIKQRALKPFTFDDAMNNTSVREDGVSVPGSGFLVEVEGRHFIVSNEHVWQSANELWQQFILRDTNDDIAVAPEIMTDKNPHESHAFPVLQISKQLTTDALAQRRIRIRGLGARIFEVEGVPMIRSECDGDDCSDALGLVIQEKDMQRHDLIGLSGAAAIDVESGDVIGVFGHAMTYPGLQGRFYMRISGPESLRNLVNKANLHHAQFEVQSALRKLLRKPAQDLPPEPDKP